MLKAEYSEYGEELFSIAYTWRISVHDKQLKIQKILIEAQQFICLTSNDKYDMRFSVCA